ncbi:aminopeptidase [Mucor ambiguus]|uniref:Aminopeptidase n=1 Tax=Mucor ambiguus TaxID=91626 RepID=A0A0C9M8M8_9FUNG|nr:aminopeptidase [Mucor ambiguus]
MTGAISLPLDDGSHGGSIKQSWNQARLWFDKQWNGEDETTPLLYNERGTAADQNQQARRKKTTFRLLVTGIALVLALALLGVSFGFWYTKRHAQEPAKLTEDPVEDDETSRDPSVVPLFHGYSKNGTVQGRIVYANYGRLQDFQFLKDQGIDLNGTIALMRYGGNFRGLKVKAAETFGCAGALIYSDPIDDGPLNKDNSSNPVESYPDGPWRSKSSAQRGSVQYFSIIAGDPLTPGYPATENATRIKYEDSPGAIILGNHRDAWVYGAVDPSSGSASLLELARIFGELLKTGWRPRRTIVLASWDAEEYGLVGSTEWVEDNAEWLDKEAAVYVNVDTAVSGSHFGVQASPSLNRILYEVTSEIHDPRTGKSVFDAWSADEKLVGHEHPEVYRLGSGSDFAPFLDHAGIASVNFAFRGDYGVYHSNYDSFRWMEKYGDPGFYYHQALVKLWGLLALRLSDSPILPLYLNDYSAEIVKYAAEITDLAAPQTFPELEVAVNKLQNITGDFEEHRQGLEKRISQYKSLDDIPLQLAKDLKKVNDHLAFFERGFIDPKGNKDRDFFKHVIFAPGLWQGYAAQIFPAIADGIENSNRKQARHAGKRAAWAIEKTVGLFTGY